MTPPRQHEPRRAGTVPPSADARRANPRAPGHDGPRQVRIIGGQWKRTKLQVADVPGLRPTPDRVRETLFNWLGQDLSGWRCLDAYAGTGALGFEAASRGAVEVVMIEREASLAAALKSIKDKLAAQAVSIVRADALGWMRAGAVRRFDLVFLDPPFDAGLFEPSLTAARTLLVDDGVAYLESNAELTGERAAALGFALLRHGRAGVVHYHLLRRAGEAAGEPTLTGPDGPAPQAD